MSRSPLRSARASSPQATVAVLTVASVATAMGNSGTAFVATMVLGPDNRGLMVLATLLTATIVVVGRSGVGTALRTRLPKERDPGGRNRLLVAYSWLTLTAAPVVGGVAVLALRAAAALVDARLGEPRLLLAAFVSATAQVVLDQLSDLRYADGQFRQGAVWSVAACGAGFSGICLAITLAPQVWLLILAQASGVGLVAALHWRAARGNGQVSLAGPDPRAARDLFRSGFPSLGVVIGLVVIQRADRYVLGATAGTAAVGIYSLAATLSGIASLLPLGVSQLAHRDAAKDGGLSWPGRKLRYAAAGTVLTAVGIAGAGWLLVVPVFGAEFSPARTLLIPLLVAEIFLAPYYVANRALLGGGWIVRAGAIGLAFALVSLACYGVTIPRWGPAGAAASSVVIYFSLSVVALAVLHRRIRSATRREAVGGVDAPPTAPARGGPGHR